MAECYPSEYYFRMQKVCFTVLYVYLTLYYFCSDPLHLVESSVHLFEQCTTIKSTTDQYLHILSSVISIALEAIACYTCVCTENIDKTPDVLSHIQRLKKLLQNWLSLCIEGSTFGCRPEKYRGKLGLPKGYIEVKVNECRVFIFTENGLYSYNL